MRSVRERRSKSARRRSASFSMRDRSAVFILWMRESVAARISSSRCAIRLRFHASRLARWRVASSSLRWQRAASSAVYAVSVSESSVTHAAVRVSAAGETSASSAARSSRSSAPATAGAQVIVTVGDVCAGAKITRLAPEEFAVQFETNEAVRWKIIRHVYSGRFSAQVGRIQPTRVAAAILNRLVR